jgi:hypothetical protein
VRERADIAATFPLMLNDFVELFGMSQNGGTIRRSIGDGKGWEREIEAEANRVGYMRVSLQEARLREKSAPSFVVERCDGISSPVPKSIFELHETSVRNPSIRGGRDGFCGMSWGAARKGRSNGLLG